MRNIEASLTIGTTKLKNGNDCFNRFWSPINPNWVDTRKGISGQNLMTWIGVIDESIIGPYFFDGSVNSQSYSNMITQFVIPELHRLGKDPKEIIFMHDGAPPHIATNVRNLLTNEFYGWIGRGNGSILAWPPRSPDFNPLDFFVWGYLVDLVYLVAPTDINDLRHKIDEAVDHITGEMLTNVQNNFMKRMEKCMEVGGTTIEHLLK